MIHVGAGLGVGFVGGVYLHAEDKEIDQSIGTIHKMDMTDDKPAAAPVASQILVVMDLKNLKVAGAHGHAIVRQFTRRSRIDFDGSGLPKGKYSLAVASSCKTGLLTGAIYKSSVTELHSFNVTSAHVATEKSLPKASLRESGKGNLVLEGKALMLLRILKDKFEVVDCKPIRE